MGQSLDGSHRLLCTVSTYSHHAGSCFDDRQHSSHRHPWLDLYPGKAGSQWMDSGDAVVVPFHNVAHPIVAVAAGVVLPVFNQGGLTGQYEDVAAKDSFSMIVSEVTRYDKEAGLDVADVFSDGSQSRQVKKRGMNQKNRRGSGEQSVLR